MTIVRAVELSIGVPLLLVLALSAVALLVQRVRR